MVEEIIDAVVVVVVVVEEGVVDVVEVMAVVEAEIEITKGSNQRIVQNN